MERRPRLKYSGQTTDQLIELASTYRVDSIVAAFDGELMEKCDRLGGLHALTDEERVILAVEAMEAEVNNGGWWQFFINSSRRHAFELVEALRRIECPQTAALADEALAIVRREASDDQIKRGAWKATDDALAALNACDRRYYAYFDGKEDIAGRLFEFIKKNRARIQL